MQRTPCKQSHCLCRRWPLHAAAAGRQSRFSQSHTLHICSFDRDVLRRVKLRHRMCRRALLLGLKRPIMYDHHELSGGSCSEVCHITLQAVQTFEAVLLPVARAEDPSVPTTLKPRLYQ